MPLKTVCPQQPCVSMTTSYMNFENIQHMFSFCIREFIKEGLIKEEGEILIYLDRTKEE